MRPPSGRSLVAEIRSVGRSCHGLGDAENLRGDSAQDSIHSGKYVGQGCHGDPPTHRWRGLVERYVLREVACYITLRPRITQFAADDSTFPQYGVLLYWPGRSPRELANIPDRFQQRWHREFVLAHHRAGDMDSAVLVGVREFLEMPQRALQFLPCAKGLLRPDQIDSTTTDSGKHELGAGCVERPVPYLGLKDRELVLTWDLGGDSLVSHNQFPHRVVQSRSEVVNHFPDSDAPDWIRRLFDVNTQSQDPRGYVEIDAGSIRMRFGIDETSDFLVERLELIQCTREFQANAGERISHGL